MFPTTFKLGKLPPKFDMRIPNLSTYTQDLPPPPEWKDWTKGQSSYNMMANDKLGDCTAAALAHQLQIWTMNVGPEVTLSDDQVVKFYADTCGYVIGDEQSDVGGNELDILKQWFKTPGLLGGYNLTGFAPFRTTGLNSIKDSIAICGGAYLGINLPKTVLNQGDFWYVPAQGPVGDGAPGTLGGHAVVAVAYNSRHIVFVSWGRLFKMSWDFFTTYTEECYALVSEAWIDKTSGMSPSGFDMNALKSNMNALSHII